MPTTLRGIWTPSDSDDWDLTVDLAAMANSVEMAFDEAFGPPGGEWVNLTNFINGFYARPGNPPQARRVGNIVFLRGQMYNPTAPTGNLPAASIPSSIGAPSETIYYRTVAFAGGTQNVDIEIRSDGRVWILSPADRTNGLGYPIAGPPFLSDGA